jgi:hypothetical protein
MHDVYRMNFPFVINPEVAGLILTFFAQVGARHLVFNFSSIQQKIIFHPITQSLILFGLFYLSTRRFSIAAAMTLIYYTVIYVLLNERHPMNVLPRSLLVSEGFIEANQPSPVDTYYKNMEMLNGNHL